MFTALCALRFFSISNLSKLCETVLIGGLPCPLFHLSAQSLELKSGLEIGDLAHYISYYLFTRRGMLEKNYR